MKKKWIKKITRRCAAFYRWMACYRRRVRMVETELGARPEAC